MITLFIILASAWIWLGVTGMWLLFGSLYYWAVDGWLDTDNFALGLTLTFVFSVPFILAFCP